YILTAVDLYLALKESLLDALVGGSSLASATWNRKKTMLDTITRYRFLLSTALGDYFRFRHWQASKAERSPKMETIRDFCRNRLLPTDVVITFNYDWCLERALYEENRWQPWDGFGFSITPESPFGGVQPQPEKSSEITVLHLHGSAGWRVATNGSISLSSEFLSQLGISLHDSQSTSGANEVVLTEPSFLKGFQNNTILQLWHKAAARLQSADKVYIMGYSLPEADSAATTLFLSTCREKAAAGRVVVVNKNQKALMRFERVLPGCQTVTASIESWLGSAEQHN
ncbi:MAG: SIR2 family protein, partial [Patescibacteria group bacterium]